MIKSIFYSESFKRGFVVSSSLNILSKIIGFINISVIAYFFGTTSATDVYFFCFVFMATVSSFLISLNSTILIPESMHIKEQCSEKESQQFLSFFLFVYIVICTILSTAAFLNPTGIFSLLSKFTFQVLNDNILILYFSIPLIVLLTINSFFSDILISYKYFSISIIPVLLNSILSILFVFVLHSQLHILSVLIGALCANVFQLFINIYLLRKNLHWSFRFTFIKIRCKTLNDIIAAQAGNFATMLTGYIPLMLLSNFPAGILSSINYSSRVPDMITLLITIQFGTVTGIKFNELYAQKKNNEIGKTFLDASSLLQFVLVPICILVFIFSHDIIAILFGRGAFDKTSISNASQFLKLFILVLPFTAHNALVARLFMGGQKIRKSYIFQIIMSCLMVLIIYVSILIVGPKGYPLGIFVFYVCNSIAAIVIMKKNFKFVPYEKTLFYTIKCLLLNTPLAILVIAAKNIVAAHSYMLIALSCVIYSALLIFLNQKMKINPTVMNVVENVLNRIKAARS